MVTKWDLVTDAERTALEATYFGKPCSACGLILSTEGDFARHFVLIRNGRPRDPDAPPHRDHYYLNLGNCPDNPYGTKEEK